MIAYQVTFRTIFKDDHNNGPRKFNRKSPLTTLQSGSFSQPPINGSLTLYIIEFDRQ